LSESTDTSELSVTLLGSPGCFHRVNTATSMYENVLVFIRNSSELSSGVCKDRKINGESGSAEFWVLVNDYHSIKFTHDLGNDR